MCQQIVTISWSFQRHGRMAPTGIVSRLSLMQVRETVLPRVSARKQTSTIYQSRQDFRHRRNARSAYHCLFSSTGSMARTNSRMARDVSTMCQRPLVSRLPLTGQKMPAPVSLPSQTTRAFVTADRCAGTPWGPSFVRCYQQLGLAWSQHSFPQSLSACHGSWGMLVLCGGRI